MNIATLSITLKGVLFTVRVMDTSTGTVFKSKIFLDRVSKDIKRLKRALQRKIPENYHVCEILERSDVSGVYNIKLDDFFTKSLKKLILKGEKNHEHKLQCNNHLQHKGTYSP
ncbi:MAG: hypothetical protein MJ237_08310 [bacterium]|nr:hypothetical protein [bacterium]